MRVLFVNENLGGHRTLHLHLRRALLEHDDVDADFFEVPAPGLWRRSVSVPVPGLARLDADLQPLRSQLAAANWVRRRLEKRLEGVDVVHVYSQNAALLSAPLLASIPTVVSTDSTNEVNGRTLPYRDPGRYTDATISLTRRFEDRVFASASRVVAQSAWIARSLEDDYGLRDIPVIPFGIMPPDMPPRMPPDVPRITFVGTSLARKGGHRLLDAFARLAHPAQLTMITPEPVEPQPGLTVIDDIGPGDPRLSEVLATTSVLALPSDIDKASYALLEGMAHGAAVLATDIGAVTEFVEHERTGLVIPPGDDDALFTAMTRLVADADATEAMGAAGQARFAERFDARTTTASLVDVLTEAWPRDRHRARR